MPKMPKRFKQWLITYGLRNDSSEAGAPEGAFAFRAWDIWFDAINRICERVYNYGYHRGYTVGKKARAKADATTRPYPPKGSRSYL